MLDGIAEGLVVAWILSCFDIHNMLIEVVQPFIDVDLTISHYYIAFAAIGMLSRLFHK